MKKYYWLVIMAMLLAVSGGLTSCSKEGDLNEGLDNNKQLVQTQRATATSSASSIELFIATYYEDDILGWDGGDMEVQVSTWYNGAKQDEYTLLVGSGYEIGYVGINTDPNGDQCGEVRITWSSHAKTWELSRGSGLGGTIISSGYNPSGGGTATISFCEGDYQNPYGVSLVLHYN